MADIDLDVLSKAELVKLQAAVAKKLEKKNLPDEQEIKELVEKVKELAAKFKVKQDEIIACLKSTGKKSGTTRTRAKSRADVMREELKVAGEPPLDRKMTTEQIQKIYVAKFGQQQFDTNIAIIKAPAKK